MFHMMAEEPDASTRVQFADSISDPKPRMKQQPTQKYDRKEIQKRLDIENWMDEQLRDLYDCEDDCEGYPQLDIDDVLKISEDQREGKLKEYLKEAKKPVESFIKELLQKSVTVKTVSSA